MAVDTASIEAALTGSFGRPLKFFESIPSTNSEALAWAAQGAPEGAVVAADHQTAGRGRRGRAWLSEPGRLLQFSVVLRPALPLDRLGLLIVGLGVACARGIDAVSGLVASIKWPNDVTVEARKLAGILVETRVVGARLDAAIAGIGINVGWGLAELPADIAGSATSVVAEMQRRGLADVPSRPRILAAVLAAIEDVYPKTSSEGRVEVLGEATARSEVVGRDVSVRFSDGKSWEGRATRLLDRKSVV